MTGFTRARSEKDISPEDEPPDERGRSGLTGAEFVLLMLGYGEEVGE